MGLARDPDSFYNQDTKNEREKRNAMNCYPFSALLSRMRYINRWGLMRATRQENLAEHTAEAPHHHIQQTVGIVNKPYAELC